MYNHAFDIGFEVISPNDGETVTAKELLLGMRKRLENLERDYRQGGDEIVEACGMPFDSFVIDED